MSRSTARIPIKHHHFKRLLLACDKYDGGFQLYATAISNHRRTRRVAGAASPLDLKIQVKYKLLKNPE